MASTSPSTLASAGASRSSAERAPVRPSLTTAPSVPTCQSSRRRPPGRVAFGAGLNTSAVTTASPYCHVAYGVLTQLRGLASYAIPKIDVQLAATFQSKPGAMLAANYAAPNSVVAPSLGRDLSGNAANVTVNLLAPGTMYGDRINQLDVRVAKTLKYGRSRTSIALDLYNVLNSSAVLTYNNTFVPGGPWLQPLTILTPRFFKITAEIEL